jgi:hypothetical protein
LLPETERTTSHIEMPRCNGQGSPRRPTLLGDARPNSPYSSIIYSLERRPWCRVATRTAVRCADGAGRTAARELIHLLTSLKDKEISRLERGEPPAPGEQLFDRSVFKEALSIVAETCYRQSLIAEYPDLKDILAKLNGQKTEQTVDSLAELWK